MNRSLLWGRLRPLPVLACCLVLSAPPAAAQEPGPKDKCPVCGMFVHGYPEWVAAIRHKDGRTSFFDGPKDLFTFLRDPGKYRPGAAPPAEILVKDYYKVAWVDARTAFFVAGSDVSGPMGKELVPFATEAGARAFMKDHGGRRLLRFAEVDAAQLKSLE